MSMRKTADDKAVVKKFRQFVRIRPLMEEEKNKNQKKESPPITNDRSGVEYKDGEVMFMDPKGLVAKAQVKPVVKKKFSGFEGVFWSFGEDPWVRENRAKTGIESDDIDHVNATNADVYDDVKGDMVNMLYEGYNQAVATYGPCNGGKTHTMFGSDKDPGVASRLIKDIMKDAEKQRTQRQAPGEKLTIEISAQSFRIYKEEVEDLLHGFPKLPSLKGDGNKVSVNEAFENGTRVVLNDDNFDKFAERLWASKDAPRRPSSQTAPNKNNRSTVVVTLRIKQSSTIEGDEEKVENDLSAYLTLADIGYGNKADSESQVDFKKINNSQSTYHQCLRRLGERGGGDKVHIPTQGSILTRMVAETLGQSSHVTLICNISPYHKHFHETQTFLELAESASKAKSKAAPEAKKDLEEFRSALEEKEGIKKAMAAQNKNVAKVKAELEGRMATIKQLEGDIAEKQEDEATRVSEIDAQEKRIAHLSWKLKKAMTEGKAVMEGLDKRGETAERERKEALERLETMRAEIEANEKKLKEKQEAVHEASDLIKRAAGLKTLLTGKAVPEDNIFATDGIELEGEDDMELFQTQSAESMEQLKAAVAKYEAVVNMNEENTKLLQEISAVLTQADEVEEEKAKAKDLRDRNKRKCLRQIIHAIDGFVRGSDSTGPGAFQQLEDIVSKHATDASVPDTTKFYQDESDAICRVLGSELVSDTACAESVAEIPSETEKAPGWAPWKVISPVRPWIISLRPRGKDGKPAGDASMGGSTLSADGEVKYRVEKQSNETIDDMAKLVDGTKAWCGMLLKYEAKRAAIEECYQEWFSRLPVWPASVDGALKVVKQRENLDALTKGLRSDIDGLEKDIAAERDLLAKEKGNTAKLKAQLAGVEKAYAEEQKKGCVVM